MIELLANFFRYKQVRQTRSKKKRKPFNRVGKSQIDKASVVGTTLEVNIERILPGGLGMARTLDATVLVALAAPGDRALVRVTSARRGVWFAEIEELLQPSPVRRAAPCRYFGACGGCDFQQLDYAAQLAAKAEIVRDCLRRIARVELEEIPIIAAPHEWHYRLRAEWQHDRARRRFGYFARGTHDVCDVDECLIIRPALQSLLTEMRSEAARNQIPENVFEYQAATGDEDSVSLAPSAGASATQEIELVVGAEIYRFDAECFFQANGALLPELIDSALAGAGGENCIDLYSGIGLFTLPLARKFARVTGVEASAHACRFAVANAARVTLANVEIVNADTGAWLGKRIEKLESDRLDKIDLMLLDPPRAGADTATLQSLLQLAPTRIVYVSCDPATLARDLRILLTDGRYELKSVTALDMFPQTHHVEVVAQLEGVGS